jgi:hypothetical protein
MATDGRLFAAMVAGDVPAVRDRARDLLTTNDAGICRLAAMALQWIGDFAEALANMPVEDHSCRAQLLARLGQLDEAAEEVGLALNAGNLNAEAAADEVAVAFNSAGRSSPESYEHTAPSLPFQRFPRWVMKPRKGSRSHEEALRRGDWAKAIASIKSTAENYTPSMKRLGRPPIPLWDGRAVDHLVLLSGSGSGDFFQFARYVARARERCARLSLVTSPRLQAIARRLLPVDEIVQSGQGLPLLQVANAFGVIDAMSGLLLGDVLGERYASPWQIEAARNSVPYLGAGSHVGLCWSASEWATERAIPFDRLSPLQSLPETRLHSLQYGARANEAAPWVTRHELRTYDDTTSLIAACGAVVTVDTSVAHLAANIGKPVHLILIGDGDCRWGTGETTPWYPDNVTIYRGNIDESVKRISERLCEPGLWV